MKALRPVALVCAGPISRTQIARLPRLSEQLGPVKATSLRVSSRACNSMRAGTPVSSYNDLHSARLIIISAPAQELPAIVEGLRSSSLKWQGKSVVLFHSAVGSDSLRVLENLGASAGSFHILDTLDRKFCLVEGGDNAVRSLRKLLESAGAKVIRMARKGKGEYLAAESLLTHAFHALMDAAITALRHAEIDPQDAQLLLEETIRSSMRAFIKTGKGAWDDHEPDTQILEYAALVRHDAVLADYYREVMASALKWRQNRFQ